MTFAQLPLPGAHQQSTAHPRKTPLLISASRRTDLPGFYPGLCAQLIRDKVQRLRTRFLYGVMFWTKQPVSFLTEPSLRSLVEELENPTVQLTITGLGSSRLEPGISSAAETVKILPQLISLFKGDPRRIRWRFDPILKDFNGLSHFEQLAAPLSHFGITECTISFPTYFSLKGNLDTQFEQARIPKWTPSEQKFFLADLTSMAEKYGIQLFACAQPSITGMQPNIRAACCIDGALFEALHPAHIPLSLPKDRSQRKQCHCVQSDDIGDYDTHPCGGGCVYCYSRAGGPKKEHCIERLPKQ
ncbi:MAG: DUF1848 family protein [Deltaproteobacteria bacterium]|nr:DUF1848 family protein [Deltaproteobacteria bacterium]